MVNNEVNKLLNYDQPLAPLIFNLWLSRTLYSRMYYSQDIELLIASLTTEDVCLAFSQTCESFLLIIISLTENT
jgi:hypothetical protein